MCKNKLSDAVISREGFQPFSSAAVLTPSAISEVLSLTACIHLLYMYFQMLKWTQKDFLKPHFILIGIISLIKKSGCV